MERHQRDDGRQPAGFMAGGGAAGALEMRSVDWASTSDRGPVEGWPESLRTTVGT